MTRIDFETAPLRVLVVDEKVDVPVAPSCRRQVLACALAVRHDGQEAFRVAQRFRRRVVWRDLAPVMHRGPAFRSN